MTHLNRMRERFTDVTPCASLAARRTRMSGCKCWLTSAVCVSSCRRWKKTGCFGAALAARVGTRVYRDFSEAQRDLQHPVRTPAAGYGPISFTNKNTNAINISLPHFRVITPASRSTHYESTTSQLALDHSSLKPQLRRDAVKRQRRYCRSRHHSLFKRSWAWRSESLARTVLRTNHRCRHWKVADAGETLSRNRHLAQALTG